MQHKLSKLNTQANQLGEQFDQVKQELASAGQRLALVNREASRDQAQFNSMRTEVAKIAATAYEQGTMNSSAALLISGNPQELLNRASVLTELSAVNSTQMHQFLAVARQVTATQQSARRARTAIVGLKNNLNKRQRALHSLIGRQQTLLAQLTPAQQVSTGVGGNAGGVGGIKYTGPTSTQAEKAVAYAYSKVGDPYVWGATGPGEFDCSGLMMAAWASAGIEIPRISYDQISDLPAVPLDALEPGDIIGFIGNAHVGMYVGGGKLIDAPTAGENVELVSLSGWYSANADAAVRP